VHTAKNFLHVDIGVLPDSYEHREEAHKGEGTLWRELRANDEYVEFTLRTMDASILPKLFPRGYSEKKTFLRIPQAMLGDMEAYRKAIAGFPGESGGRRSRMLYLSMVTITTLGYGDIVPLTTRARLLIGFEAVLGIVVIGLSLNSLSHESRR
jgi:hypothetical protein